MGIVSARDMKKKQIALLFTVCVIILQATFTYGTGNFYVGLLGYNNTQGLQCCGEGVDETTCQTECGILFEISVSGLNGTLQSKNISNVKLTLADAITIPTDLVTNPLSFHFNGWPGEVNVSVVVTAEYGGKVFKFDIFNHICQSSRPEDPFYYNSYVVSEVFPESSQLSIVFRYDCNNKAGSACWDCLEHNNTDPCPPAGPSPSSQSITVPRCNIDNLDNCSVNITTLVSEVTTPSDDLTTTANESTTLSERLEATTEVEATSIKSTVATTNPIKYQDSNSNISREHITSPYVETPTSESITPMNTQYLTTSSIINDSKILTVSVNLSLTSKIQSQSTSRPDNARPTITTQSTHTSRITTRKEPKTVTMKDERTSRMSPIMSTTTPSAIVTKIDDDPTYWPAIVGSVLGGIAFFSAIGFCIYYRRQKKLRKRQEIYNVNPKVLRNFEEYEENGTSGRADVPLETEQY